MQTENIKIHNFQFKKSIYLKGYPRDAIFSLPFSSNFLVSPSQSHEHIHTVPFQSSIFLRFYNNIIKN